MALGCSFTNSIPLSTTDFVPSAVFLPPFAAPDAPALPLALASIYRFFSSCFCRHLEMGLEEGLGSLWRSRRYSASTFAASDFRSSLAALSYCFSLWL